MPEIENQGKMQTWKVAQNWAWDEGNWGREYLEPKARFKNYCKVFKINKKNK